MEPDVLESFKKAEMKSRIYRNALEVGILLKGEMNYRRDVRIRALGEKLVTV